MAPISCFRPKAVRQEPTKLRHRVRLRRNPKTVVQAEGRGWTVLGERLRFAAQSPRCRKARMASALYSESGGLVRWTSDLDAAYVAIMTFKADVLRVLIASPSDLTEERVAAAEAINDWNAQHSAAQMVVLLPVAWETHSRPSMGDRPQAILNSQIVDDCDILVGMFWARLGTDTGKAPSGSVEEIDRTAAAGKPVMIYFSDRPIAPSAINLDQLAKLASFKGATMKLAIVGNFASISDLKARLTRDLHGQVQALKLSRRRTRMTKLDRAARMTELMVTHRQHAITPEEFAAFEASVAGPQPRTKMVTIAGRDSQQMGPNGYRTGLDGEGNLVEWIPHDEGVGEGDEESPMILRRSDDAIHAAYKEFWDKIWWNRHQVWIYNLASGKEKLRPGQAQILETAKKAARRIERKYGKRNLGWDDVELGLLSGKMSALAWVSGAEWEESLDT